MPIFVGIAFVRYIRDIVLNIGIPEYLDQWPVVTITFYSLDIRWTFYDKSDK